VVERARGRGHRQRRLTRRQERLPVDERLDLREPLPEVVGIVGRGLDDQVDVMRSTTSSASIAADGSSAWRLTSVPPRTQSREISRPAAPTPSTATFMLECSTVYELRLPTVPAVALLLPGHRADYRFPGGSVVYCHTVDHQ